MISFLFSFDEILLSITEKLIQLLEKHEFFQAGREIEGLQDGFELFMSVSEEYEYVFSAKHK